MVLFRNKAGPIAIDLGSHALRVMQLGSHEGRTRVVAAACHVYPPGERESPPARSQTIEALRGILREKKFTGRKTISALHQQDLLVKSLRLPEMPEAELASAIRFEAIERIPGLDDDAEIRFIPAGPVAGGTQAQLEVIVLAAPATAVRRHLELLRELGLESEGIDALPCAVFRPFESYLRRTEDREQINVFVDMGWSGTQITVTRGDRIAFTKSFSGGGAQFDQLVADSLSVDLARAGELRRSRRAGTAGHCDGHEPTTLVDRATVEAMEAAVRTGLEQLGKEISLCLRYYAVTFRGQRPDTITCVGGEALNTHHLEYLSEVAGLPCRVGFPLRNVACDGAFAKGEEHESMADWTTVVGLALKPAQHPAERVGR